MKILILSPLFPPDTAPSAQYVKELASRLKKHQVSVLLYGHLPEAVPGIQFVCVDKRKSLVVRTFLFLKKLVREARNHDLVLIQNGPSVELPSLLVFWFSGTPIILIESDKIALTRTKNNYLQQTIHNRLQALSLVTLSNNNCPWPLTRPQVHPLKPFPTEEINSYEDTWHAHMEHLQSIFTNRHA